MRLARRALVAALVILVVCAGVSAQLLRSDTDPRNVSPTIGTGGPVGGPTGLFTIYDGETLRKGEFTISFGISNYHRDPGSVHITDYPASFQVGLSNHVELFFDATVYRNVKVDSPLNLSSFYLPNSQVFFGPTQLGSPPAIVLAPTGTNVGSLANIGAVFRPAFNQPFVQFPFIGGSAGTFGQGPGVKGGQFGFPGFAAILGPISTVGNGNFGAAGNFPGIGSIFGSILPGVVLATAQLPCTALTGNCRPPGQPGSLNPIVVPVVYTTAPAYLPDAPFINRLSGESNMDAFVIGAKIRLSNPKSALSWGLVPFYRFYPDRARTFAAFNQMQRGSSPGANIGDFGLGAFIDGRLGKHVNIAVNAEYIYNSNPRTTVMGTGNATLLGRPKELITGVGFDFPVNKNFQPIAELMSDRYVGGRTPNAFENSPVDIILGGKIYPKRWWSLGLAYRRHLNLQDQQHFQGVTSNLTINQLSGVNVIGRGVIIVPGTTVAQTDANGFPINFQPSTDPNGYIGYVAIGRRNPRAPRFLPNRPPVISSFTPSSSTVTLPCGPGFKSETCPTTPPSSVSLTTTASDPDGDTLLYTYTVTGGKVTGDGPNVNWDLNGIGAGSYTATVEVDDGCGCVAFTSTTVTVAPCGNCTQIGVCPTVTVTGPDSVDAPSPITFNASVSGGTPPPTPTYSWSVSAGTITSGQGTPSITVDSSNVGGQTVTATVEIGGLAPECPKTASASTPVKGIIPPTKKFDEYGNIKFNDEKARLDIYATELQNQPGTTAYILVYGSCAGEAQARADRAKGYLVNSRQIDAAKVVTIDGGCQPELRVQLWIAPSGGQPPTPDTGGAISPCPECKIHRHRPARRHRKGRGDDDEEEE